MRWRNPLTKNTPIQGLLGVHSRYGLHTRAVTVYRDTLSEGFSHFVASMTAPVASGWSGCRGGTCTHWKAPPCHGAPPEPSFAITPLNCRVGGERSFADVGANGEVAPIPAVPGSEIRLLDSRDASRAWDLRRAD